MLLVVILGLLELSSGAPQPSLQFRLATPEYYQDFSNYNRDLRKASNNFQQLSSDYRKLDDSRCPPKQVLNVDGSCSIPDITQKFFVYGSPDKKGKPTPKPKVPKPKIEYNVVVIKSSESEEEKEPIVIPPPQQKTVVLVLNKDSEDGKRKVIEVESQVDNPEVYFVNYKDGENPQLPGGIDLKTALEAGVNQNSQVLGHGSSINQFLGSDRVKPSSQYTNIFKRSFQESSRSQLRQSALPPAGAAVHITQQLFEQQCPTCYPGNRLDSSQIDRRGISHVKKHYKRLAKTSKESSPTRFVRDQRKPSYQEPKPHLIPFSIETSKLTAFNLAKKNTKESNSFIPSNRVYPKGKTPVRGVWKRLKSSNEKSDTATISDLSNSKLIKQPKYSAHYRLSSAPA